MFKSHPHVIPLLEQAATRPDYGPPLDYSAGFQQFSDQFSSVVHQVRNWPGMAYWSQLKVAEGKGDEAVRSAMLILPLARDLDRNPLIIDHLVAITLRGMAFDAANYALQTVPISQKVRAALEAELASCERTDSWSRAGAERARLHFGQLPPLARPQRIATSVALCGTGTFRMCWKGLLPRGHVGERLRLPRRSAALGRTPSGPWDTSAERISGRSPIAAQFPSEWLR